MLFSFLFDTIVLIYGTVTVPFRQQLINYTNTVSSKNGQIKNIKK